MRAGGAPSVAASRPRQLPTLESKLEPLANPIFPTLPHPLSAQEQRSAQWAERESCLRLLHTHQSSLASLRKPLTPCEHHILCVCTPEPSRHHLQLAPACCWAIAEQSPHSHPSATIHSNRGSPQMWRANARSPLCARGRRMTVTVSLPASPTSAVQQRSDAVLRCRRLLVVRPFPRKKRVLPFGCGRDSLPSIRSKNTFLLKTFFSSTMIVRHQYIRKEDPFIQAYHSHSLGGVEPC
jgi:hypothetical protein